MSTILHVWSNFKLIMNLLLLIPNPSKLKFKELVQGLNIA